MSRFTRMMEAPIVTIWRCGENKFPVFHANNLNFNAYIADKRNTMGRSEIGFYRFFLYGDTFAERKAEYVEMLDEMTGKNWADYYYYLSRPEYFEFRQAFTTFCAKYALVFGLKDYTETMLKKLQLL